MRQSILTICGQWVVTGLVLVGLLLTPVTCPLVDHPHSLFDTPDAMERSSHAAHADHATHAGALHAAHGGAMRNGAPPLAGALPIPDLRPGAVMAWLTDHSASRIDLATGGVALPAGLATLPAVSAVTMSMVASGQSALHVTLLVLLAVILIARRPLALALAPLSHAVATIAPPPKRLALI